MTVKDFINNCVAEGFQWNIQDSEQEAFLRNPDDNTYTKITYKAINENNWDTLRLVIYQGTDIYHISRIVGYFSTIENWNKSKLGELNDRKKGNYRVK